MSRMRLVVIAIIAASFPIVTAVSADGMPPIPQEALDACAGKTQGDPCSVSMHGRDIEGMCSQMPESDKLFCRPSGPPPR